MILFEFSQTNPEALEEALNTQDILHATGFDLCVLSTSYKGFGYKKQIHIWITSADYENANLMILLGYIIMGHPEWKNGYIKIFAIHNRNSISQKRKDLNDLIKSGRLPISPNNIKLIPMESDENKREIISRTSMDADLTIIGFRHQKIKTEGISLFTDYDRLGNILFVNSNKEKEIK
jgi:hypothetical protein